MVSLVPSTPCLGANMATLTAYRHKSIQQYHHVVRQVGQPPFDASALATLVNANTPTQLPNMNHNIKILTLDSDSDFNFNTCIFKS